MSLNYRRYSASTLALEGVISPESVHLYSVTDAAKQEKIHAYIRENKIVFVRDGHLVVDWLRDRGFAESIAQYIAFDGWYKIDYSLFHICIKELHHWASAIKLQRFARWALWKAVKPPLENVKAFQRSASTRHCLLDCRFNFKKNTKCKPHSKQC